MASSKKAKISKHEASGQYIVTCGKHYDDNGLLRRTDWYLGKDEDDARLKQGIIRSAWKRATKEGQKAWSADLLQVLIDNRIISRATANTIVQGNTAKTAKVVIHSLGDKTKELQRYEDANGNVQNESLPHLITTICKQELTDPDMQTHFRRAFKKHAEDQPIQAVKLALEFWQMTKAQEQQQPPVTLNLGGMLALDDSASRARQIIEGFTGEQIEKGGEQPAAKSGDHQCGDGEA